MITIQQALERIEGLSEREVRRLARDRLLGDDAAPVGSSYTGEPPEDLVIQLLRSPDLSPKTRQAVIEAWKEVYVLLQEALLCPGKTTERDWQAVAVHLCGTVDVASPPELKGLVYALLDLVLYDSDSISPGFLPPAVRAAMGYDQTADRIPMWEQILRNHPPVAAYAFNALLTIVPLSSTVEQYLQFLWDNQVRREWPVDSAFLMRRASRKHGVGVIHRVLHWLDKQPYANKVIAELNRREWSRNWLRWSSADFDQGTRLSQALRRAVQSRSFSQESAGQLERWDRTSFYSSLIKEPLLSSPATLSRKMDLIQGFDPASVGFYDAGSPSSYRPEDRCNPPKKRDIYTSSLQVSPTYTRLRPHGQP